MDADRDVSQVRDMNLKHAAKLSPSMSASSPHLDKQRGRGQQNVIVKYVHVAEGGQAIVGNVSHGGRPESAGEPATPQALGPAERAADGDSGPDEPAAPAGGIAVPNAGDRGPGRAVREATSAIERRPSPQHRSHAGSPRCGARTRRGTPCAGPAVDGRKRCRMHGGAKGSGAPKGNANALKHGLFTREALEETRALRTLMRDATAFLDGMED